MRLSDVKLRALKPQDKPYKVSDGQGMHILVKPGGSKLWRLAYRFDDKQKVLALGAYPAVGLADARKERDKAKALLAKGQDPGFARKIKKAAKRTAAGNTFAVVANEWFDAKKVGWSEGYAARQRSRMDDDLVSVLGERPIAEILPLEVLEAVRRVEARDAFEMAKRVMQMASSIFCYGVATARCPRDPTPDVQAALQTNPPVKHRKALPEGALPEFFRRLEAYEGDAVTRIALKIVVQTFVRTSELRRAEWVEFENLEGAEPIWRVPAERTKKKRTLLVPLARQTVALLLELRKLTGHSRYLFPGAGKKGVMSENTLIFAMYRMGYHGQATVHGFRSTASTILNENHFDRDWVERQLAHVSGNVREVYNAAEWLPGRRRMMQWYADFLEQRETAGLIG